MNTSPSLALNYSHFTEHFSSCFWAIKMLFSWFTLIDMSNREREKTRKVEICSWLENSVFYTTNSPNKIFKNSMKYFKNSLAVTRVARTEYLMVCYIIKILLWHLFEWPHLLLCCHLKCMYRKPLYHTAILRMYILHTNIDNMLLTDPCLIAIWTLQSQEMAEKYFSFFILYSWTNIKEKHVCQSCW